MAPPSKGSKFRLSSAFRRLRTAPPESKCPPESSTAPTSQGGSPPRSPSPGIPPAHDVSTSTKQRIYVLAVKRLAIEEKVAVEELTKKTEGQVDPLDQAVQSVKQLSSDREKQSTKFSMGGKDYLLKDVVNDILTWLQKLDPLIKSVAEIQPLFVGLPFAIFRLISSLFTTYHREIYSYMKGINAIAATIAKLELYLRCLVQLQMTDVSLEVLEEALISLTSHILGFLASYMLHNRKNAFSKAKQVLLQTQEVTNQEFRCKELVDNAREAADNCLRDLALRDRKLEQHWRTEHDARLKKIESTTEVLESMVYKLDRIQQVLDTIPSKLDASELRELLGRLPIAAGATYDSYINDDFATCLAGTRTQILDLISAWATDVRGDSIFVLRGMAGTGKSTIARTIARLFDVSEPLGTARLGASFFFRRNGGEHTIVLRVIPTLVRQLAERDGSLAREIARIVADNPDISNKTLDDQFDTLVSPLLGMQDPDQTRQPSNIVIPLDALDECSDHRGVAWLLQKVTEVKTIGSFQVRWLITSRETPTLQQWRNSMVVLTNDIKLETSQAGSIEGDIRTYLCHKLHKIARANSLESWPETQVIDTLVKIASPLFIFACTLCRYISGGDTHHGHYLGSGPQARLKLFLDRQRHLEAFTNSIDRLYEVILDEILPPEHAHETDPESHGAMDILQHILFPIVLMKSPLSLKPLCRFLERPVDDVYQSLTLLSSVIQIPTSVTGESLIRPLHASFAEFLLRHQAGRRYNLNQADTEAYLFQQCLHTLSTDLRMNMCGVPSDMISYRQEWYTLPADLDYACVRYIDHMESLDDNVAFKYLHDGSELHILWLAHLHHWMEALLWHDGTSFSREPFVRKVKRLFNAVTRIDSISPGKLPQTLALLRDACWFGLLIESTLLMPPHIYHYALHFIPRHSVLYEVFSRDCKILHYFDITPAPLTEWPLALLSDLLLELAEVRGGRSYGRLYRSQGGGGAIAKVSASNSNLNRNWIATGCQHGYVRIFDGESSAEIMQFRASSRPITFMTFSERDNYLAVASAKALSIWGIMHGQQVLARVGHYEWSDGILTSMTMQRDDPVIHTTAGDTRLVNKLYGHQAQLEPEESPCDPEIQGITKALRRFYERMPFVDQPRQQTVFGFDSDFLQAFSASKTGELHRWHHRDGGSLGEVAQSMQAATLTFSWDGTRVISEDFDGSVGVYSVPSGQRLCRISSHPRGRRQISLNRIALVIISGHGDEITLWDLEKPSVKSCRSGTPSTFDAAIISPDGTTIAWIQGDCLYKWHVPLDRTLEYATLLEQQARINPSTLVLSPDGRYAGAVATDGTCHIWLAKDDALVHGVTFQDVHARLVFSACGGFLGCFGEKKYCIWSVQDQRPTCQGTLEGFISDTREIALSHGGDKLACFKRDARGTLIFVAKLDSEGVRPETTTRVRSNLQPWLLKRHFITSLGPWGFTASCKDVPSAFIVEWSRTSSLPAVVCRCRDITDFKEQAVIVPREYAEAWDVYGGKIAFSLANGQVTFMRFREGPDTSPYL